MHASRAAPRGVFVTGTDTEVGKTVITASLALALADRGVAAGVMKPVQTGSLATDPAGEAATLAQLSEVGRPSEELTVYSFAAPVAPLAAAQAEGTAIQLPRILERVESLASHYDVLLVEGIGGLLVPIGETWTVADLARAIGFPILVVARATLGTINHSLLTVRGARHAGLDVAGVVLNNPAGTVDASVATNAATIERLGEVEVLGTVAHIDGELSPERLREHAIPALDLAGLFEGLGL